MKVFEVIATNLDVNDGYFVNALYSDLDSAINCAKQHVIDKSCKSIVEDIEGVLKAYEDTSLQYDPSNEKPAIYYRSQYGNYRCVVFVKIRIVITPS